ncbi:DNA-binding response regulator [Terasakiella brassicae]|uniref:DNA-binding response regulator n=1 Tax=Terasakiella brassicae TaxID=1634917 RepID=A0A917C0L5_9PROT|nr:response regulator transcription factor [Terasakiella brassicae]GGF62295.1 DNA-binding response regulator [Terasakiella brassicae]
MRVLIADDHPMFRSGICGLMAQAFDGVTCTQVGEGEALMEAFEQPYDLAILDLFLPNFDYKKDLPDIRQSYPLVPLVIVSMLDRKGDIQQIMDMGVNGFVSKSLDPQDISAHIQDVWAGERVLAMGEFLIDVDTEERKILSNLPPRQREVLDLLSQGMSNKEIARVLDLSPFTVRSHISALMRALNVNSRTAAASWAHKMDQDVSA